MKNFKDLFVWQKSIELVVLVYKITKDFPAEEKYGLSNQMRRAGVSIPSNIAEGHIRSTEKDFGQFLAIARGSCAELETQNIIGRRLGYINESDYAIFSGKIDEVARMLGSLRSKVISK